MINTDIIIVMLIALTGLILFITEIIRVDVTAMVIMVLLILTGSVTPEEGVSGFSNTATITVLAMLILSAGLQNTGVMNIAGSFMIKISGKKEWQIIIVLMSVTAFVSAFINNTAAVAVLLPVTMRIARSAKISASKLLIPMSFGAMLGGTCTLIGTSTNILVSSLSREAGLEAFSMFEFSHLGLIFLVTGIVYMLFAGRFLLKPRRKTETMTEDYELKEYITEMIILKDSPLAGLNIFQSKLGERYGIDVLEVIRNETDHYYPGQVKKLKEGDILLVRGDPRKLVEISKKDGISIKANLHLYQDLYKDENHVLLEAVVSQGSFLNGKTIRSAHFRQRYNSNAVAVRRGNVILKKKLRDIVLRFGDSLLIESSKDYIPYLIASGDFIIANQIEEPAHGKNKTLLSTLIIISVIVTAALDIIPVMTAALAGCVLMFITRCISIRKAYEKMDWQIIFLLAGIIPLGLAIEKSGAADLLAHYFLMYAGEVNNLFIISAFYLITTLLTEILSNNAAAVLLSPVAIGIARITDMPPKPLLFAIMFAASTSFLTPVGYQTNTMVYGPGKYKYTDYFRAGALLNLILWIISSFAITYFWT